MLQWSVISEQVESGRVMASAARPTFDANSIPELGSADSNAFPLATSDCSDSELPSRDILRWISSCLTNRCC